MNVKYSANFGVGYKIKPADGLSYLSEYNNLKGYVEDILEDFPDGISCIVTGDMKRFEYYLIVDNPFEIGLEISHIKVCLDDVIDSSSLERDSEFGVVGGLLAYI
jgi:hypothetical protein